MSKYTITKHEYSLDVVRASDNHACVSRVLMCGKIGEYTYYTADDDEVKSGAKNVGDVKAEVRKPVG